ncbi:hemolysin family protein [Culicoidibacter larvae]|uniref:HlyC/CorC family transporter n=1 Tax=Culicoidibacter larvae TaxID=2579976 RepID=A0A5R8QFH3_9FIRM|nr:hemolysin family protein [Culicoidibacter larvae]TLG76791.1 HlyC/CorC family transporter [Culicoidibacter larvae]
MELVIILVLIVLNGIFSMSEISLISIRKHKLEREAKQGNKSAKAALELAENPNNFLSTVQIGITLIGILTGVFSGASMGDELGKLLATIPMVGSYLAPLGPVIVILLVTYLTIVIGELVPKRLGLYASDRVAKLVAIPMKILSMLMKPFVWLLSISTQFLLWLMRIKDNDEIVSEEEIKAMIEESVEDGEIQDVEQHIVNRVFYLGDLTVRSILTSRKDVQVIRLEDTKRDIKKLIREYTHNVYPVVGEDFDDIKGVVDLPSILRNIDKKDFDINSLLVEPTFVREDTKVYDFLAQLKDTPHEFAFVFDAYGGVDGIVTGQSVLDELVYAPSFDNETTLIVEQEDGSFLVDGQCPIMDFLFCFDLDLLAREYTNVTTVNGLFINEFEHIPAAGEMLVWHNLRVTVKNVSETTIEQLVVEQLESISVEESL